MQLGISLSSLEDFCDHWLSMLSREEIFIRDFLDDLFLKDYL